MLRIQIGLVVEAELEMGVKKSLVDDWVIVRLSCTGKLDYQWDDGLFHRNVVQTEA